MHVLCNNVTDFVELNATNFGKLNLASNASTNIKGKSLISFLARTNEKPSHILLKDILHVPELRTNRLFVAKIADHGFKVIFDKQKADIIDRNGQVRVTAQRERDLYFAYRRPAEKRCETSNQATESDCLKLWHDRLGHLNLRDLCEAVESGTIAEIKQADLKGRLRDLHPGENGLAWPVPKEIRKSDNVSRSRPHGCMPTDALLVKQRCKIFRHFCRRQHKMVRSAVHQKQARCLQRVQVVQSTDGKQTRDENQVHSVG